MRGFSSLFCDNNLKTGVYRGFTKSCKKFQCQFSACVKFHVENEWEILRMCEIDV